MIHFANGVTRRRGALRFAGSASMPALVALLVSPALNAEAAKKKGKASSKQTTKQSPKTVVDVAAGADNFKTLTELLKTAGLADTLKGTGPFTVFAPTDEAFAKVPKDQLEALKKDAAKLRAVLNAHIVKGSVSFADAVKAGKVTTMAGTESAIKKDDKATTIDGAKITKADIAASNGVIHAIDTVLMR